MPVSPANTSQQQSFEVEESDRQGTELKRVQNLEKHL